MGVLIVRYPKKFGLRYDNIKDDTIVVAMGCFIVFVGIVTSMMDVLV